MTDRERLADAVARTLRTARLPRRERGDVERELAAHFDDGLASGRPAADLIAEFGDPVVAGALIRRGARRRRRSHAPLLHGARLFTLAVLVAYVAAFARLHVGTPEIGRLESPSARRDALAAWSGDSERNRALESRALALVAAGDRDGAACALREIASGPNPGDDVAALRLAERVGGLGEYDVSWSETKARAASERLLAAMYTEGEGGHLTAEGLRIFQTWKGKETPSVAAVLLEPVYFPAPAGRGDARRELDRFFRLAADARSSAFESELEKLESSRICSFRYVAIRVPLEHLRLVRQKTRALEAVRHGVRALEVHSSDCP
jgi:hypothetical protein